MVGVLGWEHSASKFLLDTCRIVSGIHTPHGFLMSLAIGSWFNKTSSDGTCLGELPGGFCDCFFTSREVFHSLLFDVMPHPSVSYRQVFTPILYFQPSSSQSDSRHFYFNLSGLFPQSGHFLPMGVFYPALLYVLWQFVTQMRAGTLHPGSSSVLSLTGSSLPADAWSWTTDVWIIRPLISRLRQWATKYRVKIKLLNMFRLFKVIWKDYKNTLNKTW